MQFLSGVCIQAGQGLWSFGQDHCQRKSKYHLTQVCRFLCSQLHLLCNDFLQTSTQSGSGSFKAALYCRQHSINFLGLPGFPALWKAHPCGQCLFQSSLLTQFSADSLKRSVLKCLILLSSGTAASRGDNPPDTGLGGFSPFPGGVPRLHCPTSPVPGLISSFYKPGFCASLPAMTSWMAQVSSSRYTCGQQVCGQCWQLRRMWHASNPDITSTGGVL